ncbi:MAG: ATP-binding protein [Desulfoplanes sp.]
MTEPIRSICIGIVGNDPQLESILQIIANKELISIFPEIKVRGIASAMGPFDQELIIELGAHVYSDCPEMLRAHPEINTLLVIEDNAELLTTLRREVPPSVSIIDPRVVAFLGEFIVQERFCPSCKTDLFAAQSMLRTVLNAVTDDILLIDTKRNILDVNKNVCTRLGQPREHFIGQPSWTAWGRQAVSWEGKKELDPFVRALKTGEKSEGVHSQINAQGNLQYYRIYVYPITDDHGTITSFLEMQRDISDRTHMEKRLQQSEKMAALGELAAYIAHEIRNPLVSIGGFAGSLLKTDSLPATILHKVQIIRDEAKRLDDILRGILNFAKPATQTKNTVNANLVVEETMQLMGMGCDKQGVKLAMHLASDIPHVQGQAEAIKQCLINVVKNGIESMDKGGALTIRTFFADPFVHVEVTDTGIGISKRNMEQIFNPFFSTKKEGSGLGLAMTKKIIEDMGGTVTLASRKGKGTRVELLLKSKQQKK